MSLFGTYSFNRTPNGITHAPHIYDSKIWEAIQTHPCTGKADILEGVYPFIDDLPLVTLPSEVGDKQKEFWGHFELLDNVLYRLNHHNFRVSPEKLELFQKEANILGHVIKHGEI
jgi:hypothetical protein